jgi:uncharacterized OB-fold protein
MSDYAKPLPDITDRLNTPYWQAAKRHELSLQRCPCCAYIRFPAARLCPECLDENDEWVTLSGRGTVWSFGIYYHVFNRSFADDIPYNVALVQLEDGPRLITNIVGIANEQITVGMPVEVAFDDVTDEVTLVKFRPTADGSNVAV